MFPQHCNKCFRLWTQTSTFQFYVSRCGHIFCQKCMDTKCWVCQCPEKCVTLNNKMPSGVAEYFVEPLKHFRNFQRIAKFHNEQQRMYVQHFCQVNEKEAQQLNMQLQGFIKLCANLKTQLDRENDRIRKYQVYLAYEKKRLENKPYINIPLRIQPKLKYPNNQFINEGKQSVTVLEISQKLRSKSNTRSSSLSTATGIVEYKSGRLATE